MDNPAPSALLIQREEGDDGKNDNRSENAAANLHETNQFRRYLPQVLATMAKNLITVNTGLFDGLPTLIIPSVLGSSTRLNPDEMLHITPSRASWIASFASLAHPIGAIAGWILSDSIGRRKSILLATFPFIIGWTILGWFGHSIVSINVAFLTMGIGLGLKEASTLTYTGEVCEPSIRGVMLATAVIFNSMGHILVYSMGTFLSWRNVAKVCVSVPICIFAAVFLIPETPIWLLSKDRQRKALKSLQWLRGCVTSETVQEEYQRLQKYSVKSNACAKCAKQTDVTIAKCEHKESFNDKIKQITHRRIIKPFILITALQFFLQFCAISSWRPYMIQILHAYTVRWDANMVAVIMSSLGFAARLTLLPILKAVGKRRIYLASSLVTCLCCFGLSAIGFTFFPPTGWSSFQVDTSNSTILSTSTNAIALRESIGNFSYLALIFILVMQFFVNIGISSVPFMLIGEVFPFKQRSMLCSITTADRYIFMTISSKIYYNIETWFSLTGAAAFYGFISLTGFIVMFLILPETEGCSLEDIETHFSDNSRHITDIQIKRNQPNCDIK